MFNSSTITSSIVSDTSSMFYDTSLVHRSYIDMVIKKENFSTKIDYMDDNSIDISIWFEDVYLRSDKHLHTNIQGKTLDIKFKEFINKLDKIEFVEFLTYIKHVL